MNTVICPSRQELQSFAVGDLPETALHRIEKHLTHCRTCDEALRAFDNYSDDLLRSLPSCADRRGADSLSVPDRVLASAKNAVRQSDQSSSGEVALDSGRHYARLLKDGPCRLGRFELLDELGVGTFGYVFRARDVELDRIVALKIQRAGAFASDEEVKRFLREARSTASLTHPAIVSLYDTGHTEDDVCFLVTEYVEGETLEERLRRDRPDFPETVELIASLSDALQFAHEHGVVHRDIKPSNIILDRNDRPHITDFGLAKRDGGEPSMTSDGRVMGTPAYMSPEQAAGESHGVDARTDIYSLGVIFYEMLTGERPFQGTKRLLLLQVLEDEPRAPRQLDQRIPRDLETICQRAMARTPTRRYQRAAQLADDLRRTQRGETIAARPVGHLERLWRWCRRYPLAAALLIAVSLGSSAGFLYLSSLSSYFVQETALDSARMEADMLEEVNAYYSDVLANLDTKEVQVTHEYTQLRDALPLPATFTIDSAQRISQNEAGMQVRLYSNFPFRADGGPKDGFERTAIDVLSRRSTQSASDTEQLEHHRFVTIDGRPFLKYARGQRMQQSCVKCHNGHRQSKKTDWREGDLAGVLLLTRPLDRDIQRTRSGLSGAFFLMGGIGMLLVGCGLVFALRAKPRRS